jgi:hypothetical protein
MLAIWKQRHGNWLLLFARALWRQSEHRLGCTVCTVAELEMVNMEFWHCRLSASS